MSPSHHALHVLHRLGLAIGEVVHKSACIFSTPTRAPRHLDVFVCSQHPQPLCRVIKLTVTREDHRLRRHVDSYGKRLGRKQQLDHSAREQHLHDLLENREHPAVMERHALHQ